MAVSEKSKTKDERYVGSNSTAKCLQKLPKVAGFPPLRSR